MGEYQVFEFPTLTDTFVEVLRHQVLLKQGSIFGDIDISGADKWIIASDYALHDKGKQNNVIVFTLFPSPDFLFLKKLIDTVQKHDLKKTRTVDSRFIEVLKLIPALSVAVIIPEKYRFPESNNAKEESILISNQIQSFESIGPDEETVKNLRQFSRYVRDKRNHRISKEIYILGCLVGGIAAFITRLSNAKMINWMSDRDALLGGNFVAYDIAHIILNAYNMGKDVPREVKFSFSLVEEEEDPWFEELNRIPDYIAGCIADFNFQNKKTTHNKHTILIKNLIADNRKILILSIQPTFEAWKVKQIVMTTPEAGADET